MNVDLNNLDFSNAGAWPFPVKIFSVFLVAAAVVFAGYWFDSKDQMQVLDNARNKEQDLKKEFESKQATAANLDEYKKQMEEMQRSFGTLLLQLPSKTEIAELLVDISRVGLESGLEFELFKPGDETIRDFYAEFPINLKIRGTYHQLANFASGVAALPRIVTLHNLKIEKEKSGGGKKGQVAPDNMLIMDATANTYRYLDKEEMSAKKKETKDSTRKRK